MQKLFDHQIKFLQQNPNKSSLVWSCGTAKSRTALEWAKLGTDTIIICPKALKTNWLRECEKWGADPLQFLIVTKEEFRKNWNSYSGYQQLICDEVHNGFLTPNFKSQMSKALKKYLVKHKVPRVLLLSATVYTSSPWNIYNLAYYTGHVWDYMKFKYTYFTEIRMGQRLIPVPKKGIEGKLAELTKSIASVVNIYDCMDVPLQNHLDPEYFALSKEQKKAIKDNYDPLPIVRYTAQHEIENGILLGNEFRSTQIFVSDKDERILQLVQENKKIAIICRYNAQIGILQAFLRNYRPLTISGDVKNRDAVCLEAEKRSECVILIQADCNVGYQLPSFELCIFASMSYSYVAHEQMSGRFLRMDKPSRTTFMYLLTEGESIDQAVYDSVKKKEDFKINLYSK